MKKLMVALLVMLFASTALAQAQPTIGMYFDQNYEICQGDQIVGVPAPVHFAVWLPPEIAAVRSVEFRVRNLPDEIDGLILEQWASDPGENPPLQIGNLGYDKSLAWTVPIPGPWAYLGAVLFIESVDTWIGDDHAMVIDVGLDLDPPLDYITVVDDVYVSHEALGGQYTFNCTNPDGCDCFEGTPTEDATWSSIKSLY